MERNGQAVITHFYKPQIARCGCQCHMNVAVAESVGTGKQKTDDISAVSGGEGRLRSTAYHLSGDCPVTVLQFPADILQEGGNICVYFIFIPVRGKNSRARVGDCVINRAAVHAGQLHPLFLFQEHV